MENELEFIDKIWHILCESKKMDVAEIETGIEKLTSHIRSSERLWQMHWFLMQIASESDLGTVVQLTLNTFHSLVSPSSCSMFLYDKNLGELYEYKAFGKITCEGSCTRRKQSLLQENLSEKVNVRYSCDCQYDYIRAFPINNREGELLGYLVGYCQGEEYEISESTKLYMDIFSIQIGLSIEDVILKDEMERLAYTDELTSLANKRVLLTRLEEDLLRCYQSNLQGKKHKGIGFVIFDVDNFKHYNDTFGHVAGDYVLKQIGSIINANTSEGQLGARYGGEELCVVLEDATLDETYVLAEKIRTAIQSCDFEFREVTVSGGVAHYPSFDLRNPIDLINAADTALYKSKKTGKNKISVFTG